MLFLQFWIHMFRAPLGQVQQKEQNREEVKNKHDVLIAQTTLYNNVVKSILNQEGVGGYNQPLQQFI